MSDWQTEIDLTAVWPSGDVNRISISIASQLRMLDLRRFEWLAETALDLAQNFEELSRQEVDVEDFDELMNSLYDWADNSVGGRKKLCWVRTF